MSDDIRHIINFMIYLWITVMKIVIKNKVNFLVQEGGLLE